MVRRARLGALLWTSPYSYPGRRQRTGARLPWEVMGLGTLPPYLRYLSARQTMPLLYTLRAGRVKNLAGCRFLKFRPLDVGYPAVAA